MNCSLSHSLYLAAVRMKPPPLPSRSLSCIRTEQNNQPTIFTYSWRRPLSICSLPFTRNEASTRSSPKKFAKIPLPNSPIPSSLYSHNPDRNPAAASLLSCVKGCRSPQAGIPLSVYISFTRKPQEAYCLPFASPSPLPLLRLSLSIRKRAARLQAELPSLSRFSHSRAPEPHISHSASYDTNA
ncbi:hypothetical protein MA16_Dca006379 [Dendrobium catenatum]|uniref:Uncharacterized protein n=1 Tax=Dendrobium catenatum TaxID=906689 RepID=A0A2I0X7L5_9ASPA|nr:hypothetical protein MA16_Dca006379 [Dendrobium catenatum]